MSDWKIGRRAGLCLACSRGFAELEQHFSLLCLRDGLLAREDRCAACFGAHTLAPLDVYWRTRYRPNAGGPRLDLESLEALFLSLEGRDEDRLAELRYLICLLLMRKRRLKLRRVLQPAAGESGQEALLVARPRRPQEYTVRVFELSAERQEALRSELKRIFEGVEVEQLLRRDATPEPEGESAPAAQTPP